MYMKKELKKNINLINKITQRRSDSYRNLVLIEEPLKIRVIPHNRSTMTAPIVENILDELGIKYRYQFRNTLEENVDNVQRTHGFIVCIDYFIEDIKNNYKGREYLKKRLGE